MYTCNNYRKAKEYITALAQNSIVKYGYESDLAQKYFEMLNNMRKNRMRQIIVS